MTGPRVPRRPKPAKALAPTNRLSELHLRELEDDAVTRDIDAALDAAGDDDLVEWSEAAARATLTDPS
jgi:hypothetical protein